MNYIKKYNKAKNSMQSVISDILTDMVTDYNTNVKKQFDTIGLLKILDTIKQNNSEK